MSCYIVGKQCIDRVVTTCSLFGIDKDSKLDVTELGQMFWDENIKAYNFRYNDTVSFEKYEFELPVNFIDLELEKEMILFGLLSSVKALNYQCSETDEYETSDTKLFLRLCEIELFKNLKISSDKYYNSPIHYDEIFNKVFSNF